MTEYRSRRGYVLSQDWVERNGQAELHQLDFYERQGLNEPLTVRFVAAVYTAAMSKARARES